MLLRKGLKIFLITLFDFLLRIALSNTGITNRKIAKIIASVRTSVIPNRISKKPPIRVNAMPEKGGTRTLGGLSFQLKLKVRIQDI